MAWICRAMVCPELWWTTNAGAHFTYIAKVFPFILKYVSVIVQGKREVSKWNLKTTKMHHCENFATDNLKRTIRRQLYAKWKKKGVRFNTYRGLFFVKDTSQNMAKTWYIKLRACARVRFFRIFDEAYKCLGSSSIYDNYILCHTSSFFSFRYPVQDWWISVKQECRAALFHSPMQMFHFPAETNFCSLNIISTSCLSSNLLGADATRPSCSLQTSSVLGQPLVTN